MATSDTAPDGAAPHRPVSCSWCGRSAEGDTVPLSWSTQTSARGAETLCVPCTRINVRSIEAKLDSEWW